MTAPMDNRIDRDELLLQQWVNTHSRASKNINFFIFLKLLLLSQISICCTFLEAGCGQFQPTCPKGSAYEGAGYRGGLKATTMLPTM